MQVECVPPDHPAWSALCAESAHDFYHTAAYHAFAAREEGGEARLWTVGEGDALVAWPTLLTTPVTGLRHAASAYGYGGPFGRGLANPESLAAAWSCLLAAWRAAGVATVFTRLHPILDEPSRFAVLEGEQTPCGGSVRVLGRSVSIDLTLDTAMRQRRYQKILRQEVRAAGRAGLVVEADHDWRHLDRFATLYRETMAANDAAARYRFDAAYFASLRATLGSAAHLAVIRHDDTIVGGLLYTVVGRIAQAHLTGVDPAWRRHSPLKCLIDGVADLAHTAGAERLHLGAGRGGFEDSLFDFKRRFSPDHHPFAVGRWIVDATRYCRALEAHGIDRKVESRFFPAMLAPAGTVALQAAEVHDA